MITPRFDVDQNEEFIIVDIYCPYIRSQDVEFYMEGEEFKFYAKPYFLRLTFPGRLIEDGREKAKYDINQGLMKVHLPKENPGEYFQNLDLLTQLLAKKTSKSIDVSKDCSKSKNHALIEVISSSDGRTLEGLERPDEEEDYDWEMDQKYVNHEEEDRLLMHVGVKYGFNQQYSQYFHHVQEDLQEIIELEEPERTTLKERRQQRLFKEVKKFDEEYYISDYMEDNVIPCLDFEPFYVKEYQRLRKEQNVSKVEEKHDISIDIHFSEEEKKILRELPNKEFLIDDSKVIYLGLVDIIYAYCYNHRTTFGENSVESRWTICRISATLSFFELFSTLKETLISGIRRSLAYPLYRHWKLSMTILEDVAMIFKLGRRVIIKCLLEIFQILEHNEFGHYLSKLYIQDYCIWLQQPSTSNRALYSLGKELSRINIDKNDIGFDLIALEAAAKEIE